MATKNTNKINSWFDGFDRRIAGMPDIVAETATENFIGNFQRESFDGKPWKPLSQKTRKGQRRSVGRILTRTGKLQRSIRPTIVEPDRVRISAGSSRIAYARVHNEGYTGIQTVKSHTNKNFMGRGQSVTIKSHQRRMHIPRRQYMGNNRLLRTELKVRIHNHLKSR